MAFLFLVVPHLTKLSLRTPLLAGFASYIIGQTLLISVPVEGSFRYLLLCVSLVFDGFGLGTLAMLAESLVALHVNAAERARVMAIQHMIIMFSTAPFGWIGGLLSGVSRNFPFVLNIALLVTGILVTLFYYARNSQTPAEQAIGAVSKPQA
jgi:MFS family permease